jgi:hypothetical protein
MDMSNYEDIRNVKARYFRYLDTRAWKSLRGILTEDFVGDFGPSDAEQFTSADAFVENLKATLKDATTVHHGHMPEIEFQGDVQATAVWSMEDIVQTPQYDLHGYGHFSDEYRLVDGEWLISNSRLTRLKLDFTPR